MRRRDVVVVGWVFHLRDHLLAAAGIAGDGVDADRIIGWQHACHDERADQGDRAGRVAAGIGDQARAAIFSRCVASISAKP